MSNRLADAIRRSPNVAPGDPVVVPCQGDVLCWADRIVSVVDIAPIPGADTYVTLEFLDRPSLPMSVRLDDLNGATFQPR